jgi:hypothetical protein
MNSCRRTFEHIFLWFFILISLCNADLPHPAASISSTIPNEVDVSTHPSDNPIAIFDDFSWREFIALNWPAVAGKRGVADSKRTIGDFSDSNTQVVWATWKADYELFQKEGMPPSEWSSFDALTPCADVPFDGSGHTRVIGAFSKFGDFNQAGFGHNPFGPLVSQNSTYVRYEVRMNEAEFSFIRDHKLYLKSNFPAAGQQPLRFNNGSIEVKAAWRVLKDDESSSQKEKYYSMTALVLDPVASSCRTARLGLVGLHIVQKTALRPQWIWSTFEHIDNVPGSGAPVDITRQFSFNNPTKPQVLDPPTHPAPISTQNPPVDAPKPMQVVRLKSIAASTAKTNDDYRKLLRGTVWENYQLVVTQWPTQPQPDDGAGAPFPGRIPKADGSMKDNPDPMTNIANTAMETYFQGNVSTSCMACHDIARNSSTDFVWFMQLRAFGAGNELNKDAIKALRNVDLAK